MSEVLEVLDLSHDGRGVARRNGKAVFIRGALPGEKVTGRHWKHKSRFDEAELADLLEPSAQRVEPGCQHFGICGGCQLQHCDGEALLAHKQASVSHQLTRMVGLQQVPWSEPLTGPQWHYRRRARLAVELRRKRVQLGFRQASSRQVVAIEQCPVLEPVLQALLIPLRNFLDGLDHRQSLLEVEMVMDDQQCVGLNFMRKGQWRQADLQRLQAFVAEQSAVVELQANGESVVVSQPLTYMLQHDVAIDFHPGDFIQGNQNINRQLIDTVLAWLQLDQETSVLELFAGLGNFTLPIARQSQEVWAAEGHSGLVQRAQANAQRAGLGNVQHFTVDLSEPWQSRALKRRFDVVFLDPPRQGAAMICDNMSRWKPQRVVYVSCNPATFARDAASLAQQGLHLQRIALADMFPQTEHTELVALFGRAA